ncbi:MAG: TIGR02186 family protein [Pseudomonadota bacterium]
MPERRASLAAGRLAAAALGLAIALAGAASTVADIALPDGETIVPAADDSVLPALPEREVMPPPELAGERVVARLSQSSVAITTGFTGSELELFGAVYRERPPPPGPLDVIVVITGPSTPVTLRKRERRFGIWVSGREVEIDAAPSLYAVAATRPLAQILSHTDALRHRIGLDHVIRLVDAPEWLTDQREAYREAVVRLHRARGLYYLDPGGVRLDEETLFHTEVALPANLTEGRYLARVFLLREGAVIDATTAEIAVGKVGLERFLFALAHQRPAVYGIASVVLALTAGWLASALFRWLLP